MEDDRIEANESDYLFTEISQLTSAGDGLYTAVNIFEGEVICLFRGENLTEEEAELRIAAKEDQYFINLLDGSILDSKHVDCFAKYANDADGPGSNLFENNAHIGLNESNEVCLVANRNIEELEEIFCGYGKNYWERHG